MTITKKSVVKYAILPEFWPRFRNLAGTGFIHVAYLMAVIYSAARLLPPDHPYLQPQNAGRFTIRNVMSEAANNLVFSKNNIDQIIIFFLMLAGAGLLILQFIILIAMLITQPALAQFYDNFIGNPNPAMDSLGPSQDIAFMILDRVFGVPGIFESCISEIGVECVDRFGNHISTPPTFPFPIHIALHSLLAFYSQGILFIGIIMILYFVVTIIGETATTGTPFGQRYNKSWVPIRMVLFFALLVPLDFNAAPGLNGAQLITFYTAKWGSNLASNGWGHFNYILTENYTDDVSSLIAQPNIPEIGGLNQFFFLAQICKLGEERANAYTKIKPYLVRPGSLGKTTVTEDHIDMLGDNTTYLEALEFSEGGTITIRYGELDPGIAKGDPLASDYGKQMGNVFPFCGEIQINPTSLSEKGALAAQGEYYKLLTTLWEDVEHKKYATCFLNRNFPAFPDRDCEDIPNIDYTAGTNLYYTNQVRKLVKTAIAAQIPAGFTVPEDLLKKGWGGAAIWYNRIAEMNGAVTSAIFAIPKPHKYPYAMEEAASQHREEDERTSGANLYDPKLADGREVEISRNYELALLTVLHSGYKVWDGSSTNSRLEVTGNFIIDTIHMIFGTRGLLDIKNNASVHPLAQLSALGSGMIEAAIRNVLIASAKTLTVDLTTIFDSIPALKTLISTASGFLSSIVSISLVMGITLYYVLPLLPFIYFMFAVGGWVKSIFEAIVAMPLWALAHIHIDGDGIPGQYASNGYFLLLEIFLRPILIVFGLLASISIFSALVLVLNQVFDIVVSNVGGVDPDCVQGISECSGDQSSTTLDIGILRGPIDQLFMTIIYTMVVYMIGLGSFKMIDQIPNNIMRWMGVATKSFQEDAGNLAQEISGKMYKGSQISISQVSGGLSGGQVAALQVAYD